MRKIVLTLIASFIVSIATTSAMSYEQARIQALFLTDKMAYELNLTEAQYEAAYEINLDYLMSVNTVDDLYGIYWSHRNVDLSYILYDWQYRAFIDAPYFYRPLRWDGGYWRFGVYARYPRRDYYYFGRPAFYNVYNGAHSWRIIMGQPTRMTVQEVSVINNDGTLMDLETTSTTPHEGVRHVRR